MSRFGPGDSTRRVVLVNAKLGLSVSDFKLRQPTVVRCGPSCLKLRICLSSTKRGINSLGKLLLCVRCAISKSLLTYNFKGFEELLSTSNVLNRKLEEVLGMTREYETISSLWNSFHELMRRQKSGDTSEEGPGLPGTGGHTLSSK